MTSWLSRLSQYDRTVRETAGGVELVQSEIAAFLPIDNCGSASLRLSVVPATAMSRRTSLATPDELKGTFEQSMSAAKTGTGSMDDSNGVYRCSLLYCSPLDIFGFRLK